jgi:hypothetical protein
MVALGALVYRHDDVHSFVRDEVKIPRICICNKLMKISLSEYRVRLALYSANSEARLEFDYIVSRFVRIGLCNRRRGRAAVRGRGSSRGSSAPSYRSLRAESAGCAASLPKILTRATKVCNFKFVSLPVLNGFISTVVLVTPSAEHYTPNRLPPR